MFQLLQNDQKRKKEEEEAAAAIAQDCHICNRSLSQNFMVLALEATNLDWEVSHEA